MPSDHEAHLQWLKESLLALKGLPEEQVAHLRAIGHHPLESDSNIDELALEFDDAFVLMPQLVESGVITAAQFATLKAIDERFADLSGLPNAKFWTVEALSTAKEWADVRHLASRALKAFGWA